MEESRKQKIVLRTYRMRSSTQYVLPAQNETDKQDIMQTDMALHSPHTTQQNYAKIAKFSLRKDVIDTLCCKDQRRKRE